MRASCETFSFGPFRLQPERRLLLADGLPVPLSGRAYDILEFLVRNRDRIVSRDEIVAHVWKGVVVGDNNLSVQMSSLRRVLADHDGGGVVIINFAGRGYRFVAEVAAPTETEPIPTPPPSARRRSGRRRTLLRAGTIFLMLAVIGGMYRMSSLSDSAVPDRRLTIAVEHFTATDSDPHSAALARFYEEVAIAHLRRFDDVVLYPQGELSTDGFRPHFRITGTVGIIGSQSVITIRLLLTPNWQVVGYGDTKLPSGSSDIENRSAAIVLANGLRGVIFEKEQALRHGPPQDGLDLLIDARVMAGAMDDPETLKRSIALAERALKLDPASRAGKAFLAHLLVELLQMTDARVGMAPGKRACALIDEVLVDEPTNVVFIAYRALVLATMGYLPQAERTVERGIEIDPAFEYLHQLHGEILQQMGDVAGAEALIRKNHRNPQDDRLAILAMAGQDYPEALRRFDMVLDGAGHSWDTPFTMLMKASVQLRLRQIVQARETLSTAMTALPPEFRHVTAQRQGYYALPSDAWNRFTQDLLTVGMPL